MDEDIPNASPAQRQGVDRNCPCAGHLCPNDRQARAGRRRGRRAQIAAIVDRYRHWRAECAGGLMVPVMVRLVGYRFDDGARDEREGRTS